MGYKDVPSSSHADRWLLKTNNVLFEVPCKNR